MSICLKKQIWVEMVFEGMQMWLSVGCAGAIRRKGRLFALPEQ